MKRGVNVVAIPKIIYNFYKSLEVSTSKVKSYYLMRDLKKKSLVWTSSRKIKVDEIDDWKVKKLQSKILSI